MSRLEQSFTGAVGSRKRSPLMPEKLTLQERFRKRRAVDGDKRFCGPRAALVDRSSHQLLPRAGLTRYQHRCVGRSYTGNLVPNVLDSRASAHNLRRSLQSNNCILEPDVLPQELGVVGQRGEPSRVTPRAEKVL